MAYLYPRNIEQKIGFDSIREYLESLCHSQLGIGEISRMDFSSDRMFVIEQLHQTHEMKILLESADEVPEVSFNVLGDWFVHLKTPGTYASAPQFKTLLKTLISFNNVKFFFTKRESRDEGSQLLYPYLAGLFDNLNLFPELIHEIERIIDKDSRVKDSASPELAEVRQKLVSMQGLISRTIQRIYAKAVKDGVADKDTAPIFRDGRLLIPVSAANKRSIKGIVQDESASGKTVFIEPVETVEIGNRIKELELEENRIIIKILTALSDEVRPFVQEILESNRLLGLLDFIMAKARFAIDVNGNLPFIEKKTELEWYGAVHPVLFLKLRSQQREVVPLNIHLDSRNRILLISGPNAGGKSVALKTVGIIQYMMQCGLLPTLHDNSHLGIFNKIFIDIGDEQSIEDDLSTYSSHLKNMRQFLLRADGKSLVLIDEIGSGTEPNIGSSIAKAILTELYKSKCYGVITTHYHNLKRFAEETDGFVNGAMLYDRQKLQPTFQLSIGSAGSSFALEIAGKIGLPKTVIEAAKKDVGEEYVESDRFMMEIARDRKYWQGKRASIKEREARLEQLEEKYHSLISEIKEKRKSLIREAQEEASNLISSANQKIEKTISDIRQIEAEKTKTKELRKELVEFKQELTEKEKSAIELKLSQKLPKQRIKKSKSVSQSPIQDKQPAEALRKGELQVGDYVKMGGSNSVGRILSISGKECEVAFGNLRTVTKLSKLTMAAKPKESVTNGVTILNGASNDASRLRQLEFRDELDIRGLRADEALDRVIHFIDDAIQFNIGKVRILHGTGGGILRQLVRQQLGATSGVVKFEDEDVRLGGAGITVVTLR